MSAETTTFANPETPVRRRRRRREFEIRLMQIADLHEVFRLGESCFRADLWPMLYREWDEYEVASMFNGDGDYCLVAENTHFDPDRNPPDERIVGFILGTVMAKPGSVRRYGYVVWKGFDQEGENVF